MTIEDWLAAACGDAERRGLADLKPLLASLAESTRALRSADWEQAGPPPAAPLTAERPAAPDDGAPR